MTVQNLLRLAIVSLLTPSIVIAAPAGLLANQLAASTTSSSTGAEPSFVSDALVCGIMGYTEGGNDNELSAVLGADTLQDCRDACNNDNGCQSVSWADIGVCFLYSEPMHCDHLVQDDTSMYSYYDKDCPYPRNMAVGGGQDQTQ